MLILYYQQTELPVRFGHRLLSPYGREERFKRAFVFHKESHTTFE